MLLTPLRDALLNSFYICEEKTHPDTMVLTALTQFSCKVGHLFAPVFTRATAQHLGVLYSLEFQDIKVKKKNKHRLMCIHTCLHLSGLDQSFQSNTHSNGSFACCQETSSLLLPHVFALTVVYTFCCTCLPSVPLAGICRRDLRPLCATPTSDACPRSDYPPVIYMTVSPL